jgi:hypothetical protein
MWLVNRPPSLSCCCVDHPESIPALSIKWVDCCHALCIETPNWSFNILWTSKVCLDCTASFCAWFRLFAIYICGILQVLQTLSICNMAWRQRGCGGMALPIHDRGTWWGGLSLSGPDPFTPQKRPGAHCTGGLGGPQGLSRWVRKILLQWVGTVNHPFGTMWMFLSVPISCEQWDSTILYSTVGTELPVQCTAVNVNCLVL